MSSSHISVAFLRTYPNITPLHKYLADNLQPGTKLVDEENDSPPYKHLIRTSLVVENEPSKVLERLKSRYFKVENDADITYVSNLQTTLTWNDKCLGAWINPLFDYKP